KRLPEQVRTLERLCQTVSKEGLELPELLIGQAPLPGRAAKLGRQGAESSAQAEVLGQPDFDAKKFSGLWYVVPMVSDCKVFRDKKDHLLTSTSNVKATAEGSLSVYVQLRGCNQIGAEYLREGCQGHIRVPSRTQEASPQALKAFQDFYPTVGLPEDTVVTLPKSGTRRAPSCGKPRLPSPAPPPFRSPGRHRQEMRAPRGQGSTLTARETHPPVGSWHLWGNRGALCRPALWLDLLQVHRFPSTGPEAERLLAPWRL
ncbi:hypothetical protein EI555_013285, partial [Monodon monoceros]